MRRQRLSGVLLLIVFTFGCGASWASPFRILHTEQVELPLDAAVKSTARSGAKKPGVPAQLILNAYGQQFELNIQSNDSLTAALPPALLSGKALYRGEITGLAGSWARFTVIAGDIYGALWDGSDFYSIQPGHAVEPFLAAPLTEAARDATFVYRLSDTEGGVEGAFCGSSSDIAARGAALTQYRSLVSELKSLPMLAATATGQLQIEVALIADYELSTRFSDPAGAMLARVNIADGIFSGQVGVTLIPTDLQVFNDSGSSPFVSTAPSTLLQQLSSFRNSTPTIRDRGLAHLVTGKILDGDIAGVAYRGSLCDPVYGVGLSEGHYDSFISALIMAHELGHNFGAPHDTETGSACVDAPSGYLMSPAVNGSSTFSNCSLAQMQPHIQAAACVVPLKVANVAIQAPTQLQALVGEELVLPVEVRSTGELTAQNVRVALNFFNLSIESADVGGGTCTSQPGAVSCLLGSMPSNDTRQITLRLRPLSLGARDVTIEATATGDSNYADNRATTRVLVDTPADIAISSAPQPVSGLVRTPIAVSLALNSFGARTARNVTARLVLEDLRIVSATPTGGSCTANENVLDCSLGDIPSGSTLRIDLTIEAARVTQQFGSLEVRADNDVNTNNNYYSFPVAITPARDLKLETPVSSRTVLIDAPFDFSFLLRSTGVEASDPATVTLYTPFGEPLSIDSATVQGGTCTVGASDTVCAVGGIEAGGTRTITVRAHGSTAGQRYVNARVDSQTDDVPGNNSTQFGVVLAPAVEITINALTINTYAYTGMPFKVAAFVDSFGINDASTTVRATIPAELTIRAATLEGGSCNTVDRTVTCVRSLPRGVRARLDIELEAPQAGSFSAPLTVSAPGDTTPANNSTTWSIVAQDGIDVRMQRGGTPATAWLGVPQTLSLAVINAGLQASGVYVNVTVPYHVVIESATTQGSCTVNTSSAQCFLDTMAARETRSIEVRVRATSNENFFVSAEATAPYDINPENNSGSTWVTVSDRQGDAAVQIAAATAAAQVGQSLALPAITVSATAAVDEASIFIPVDLSLVAVGTLQAQGGTCLGYSNGYRCQLGTIDAGTTRTISLTLNAIRAGSFSSNIAFSARNDTNAANNSAQISVSLTEPPAPPPPPPASSGGGGGGGGSMGPYGLLALLLLAVARDRRKTAVPVHN